jgi:hypothetical protein
MSFFTDLTNLSSMTWSAFAWSDLTGPNLTGLNLTELKLALPNLAILDLIALGIILFALFLWLVSKQSEARLERTLAKESDESLYEPQFKCVVFGAGNNPCNRALKFESSPILISNAPKLPLQGCMSEKCECRLLQHDDRRSGKDRRDNEVLDKRKKSIYANKRLFKDRRRASIQEFLLPKYRTLV